MICEAVTTEMGTNPVFEPNGRYHPFDGDGMVHAVRVGVRSAVH